MRNSAELSWIRLPGLALRWAMTPSMGAMMLVYDSSSWVIS